MSKFSCSECPWCWQEEIDDGVYAFPYCHRNDGRCLEDDIEDQRRYEEERQFWADMADEIEEEIYTEWR